MKHSILASLIPMRQPKTLSPKLATAITSARWMMRLGLKLAQSAWVTQLHVGTYNFTRVMVMGYYRVPQIDHKMILVCFWHLLAPIQEASRPIPRLPTPTCQHEAQLSNKLTKVRRHHVGWSDVGQTSLNVSVSFFFSLVAYLLWLFVLQNAKLPRPYVKRLFLSRKMLLRSGREPWASGLKLHSLSFQQVEQVENEDIHGQ